MTEATIHDLTLDILKNIRDEIRDTNRRLERLETATVDGFQRMEARFDNLLTFAGDRYREYGERIAACEQGLRELRERVGA